MKTSHLRFLLFPVLSLCALSAIARAESIAIDFGKQSAESSYLLFGGGSPNVRHTQAWEELARAGVTFVRFNTRLGLGADPKDITLEDYRAHMGEKGSVADINSPHWNWSEMEGGIALCRANGMKSLVILCYCPRWLGYNGDFHAPPRDFAVWKDLVKQIVRRFADRVDYWEIWNEPNGPNYMKLEGSPYPAGKDGMLAAYLDICRHTLDAIHETGAKVRVGGPVLATFNSAPFMDKFLAHDDVTQQLDFLSHHIYFNAPVPNRCFPPAIYEMEKKHGVGPLPLFITEWNSNSSVDEKPAPLKNSPESVGWVGKSFVLFLQWGVRGATFYNFHEGRKIDDHFGGAYKMIDGDPQLFRFVKVFHLLSKVLGLGDASGPIKVFDSRVEALADEMTAPPLFVDSLYSVGCLNAQNTPVVIVANPSDASRTADIAIANLPGASYRVQAFVVRPDHAPHEATVPTPLFECSIAAKDGRLSFPVSAHSVVGLRLERLP